MSRQGVLKPEFTGVPSVPLQDEANVAGQGMALDVADEAPLVESVKQGEWIEHRGLLPGGVYRVDGLITILITIRPQPLSLHGLVVIRDF